MHGEFALMQTAVRSTLHEIESPGALPHGMTVEQLKSGTSRPRNRVIARILRELDIMEAWGSGYRRIRQSCERLGHPLPEWQELGPVIRTVFAPHPETLVPHVPDDQIYDTINDTINETT